MGSVLWMEGGGLGLARNIVQRYAPETGSEQGFGRLHLQAIEQRHEDAPQPGDARPSFYQMERCLTASTGIEAQSHSPGQRPQQGQSGYAATVGRGTPDESRSGLRKRDRIALEQSLAKDGSWPLRAARLPTPLHPPATSLVVNATDRENHHFNGVASVAAGAFGVGELWNWTINH
jgi:hypothetical protein